MITDVTAKVTFDRCICVCSYESLLTGLPYIVCSCNRIESNAEESGVAACVTAAVRLDQHCSQTGLHGEEPQMRERESSQSVLFSMVDGYLPVSMIMIYITLLV